jgi:serine/threonine protein kinase
MPLFTYSLRSNIALGIYNGQWRFIAARGAELAEALQYAHGLGFIHRDFKPDNLLYNADGPLMIADWGLGYFVHKHSQVLQKLTRGGMGTEYYCSFEQWNTGKCDGRGDVYSLGMTLDEWITGRQRIGIGIGAGVNGPATLERSAGSRHINAVLRAMTERSITNRLASMRVVAAELRRAIALG